MLQNRTARGDKNVSLDDGDDKDTLHQQSLWWYPIHIRANGAGSVALVSIRIQSSADDELLSLQFIWSQSVSQGYTYLCESANRLVMTFPDPIYILFTCGWAEEFDVLPLLLLYS